MEKQYKKMIKGIGTVLFGKATIKMIGDAHKAADKVDNSSRARAFTSHVLAGTFLNPKKTPEEISQLTEETLNEVVEVVVDLLGIREHFSAIEEKNTNEKFYQAHRSYENALFEDFRNTIKKNMGAFSFQWKNPVAGFGKLLTPMPNLKLNMPIIKIEEWSKTFTASGNTFSQMKEALRGQKEICNRISESFNGFNAKLREITAGFSAVIISAQQLRLSGVFRDLEKQLETHRAFSEAGWPIAPSMPDELIQRVVAMHKQGKTKYISRTIIGYYQRNKNQHLKEAVEAWGNNILFEPRMKILNDALQAHCQGLYTLSYPTVVPQIEGILRSFVFIHGLVDNTKRSSIRKVYEAATDEYEPSNWLIVGTLLCQLENNIYYSDPEFEDELKKTIKTRCVTRDTVTHGIALNYDKLIHSLQTFLLLDAVSALREPRL